MSVCTLLFHIHHGVEPYILEDESFKRVFSVRLQILSSRRIFCNLKNGLRSRMH